MAFINSAVLHWKLHREAKKIMWTFDSFPQDDLVKRRITLLGGQTKDGILPLADELVDVAKRRFQSPRLQKAIVWSQQSRKTSSKSLWACSSGG